MDSSSVDIQELLKEKFKIQNQELLERVGKVAAFDAAPKGTRLLEAGEMPVSLHILYSGICRGFLEDENGKDSTDCFATEPGTVLWGSGRLDQPSVIGVETLSDCELIRLPRALILELMEDYDVMRVFNRYLFHALEMHWHMRQMMYQHNAMERYRWFLKQYPGLIDQVNKRFIASFLGMTPVSLSRLRKQLREDGQEA